MMKFIIYFAHIINEEYKPKSIYSEQKYAFLTLAGKMKYRQGISKGGIRSVSLGCAEVIVAFYICLNIQVQ